MQRVGVLVAVAAAACGPGAPSGSGDAGAGQASCASGSATATARPLVSGLASPFAIAVDDSAVYFTEVPGGGTATVKRADKSTGANVITLVSEALSTPEEIAVDDQWVYYRTPTLKRVAKNMAGTVTVLASGYDDLHSSGLFAAGGQVFFGGNDTMGRDLIIRVDADGNNKVELTSAPAHVRLVGIDATNLYYSIDTATNARQLALPRAGGTPRLLATGEGCFAGGIDATYLYCAGVTHPFKVNLAGIGGQIALCPTNFNSSDGTLGNLAVAKGHFYVMDVPHPAPLTMPPNTGRVLEVSPFGGGRVIATGIDVPYMVVTDGSAMFYTENRLGSVMRIDLP